jgi:prolyl oligopeptidase
MVCGTNIYCHYLKDAVSYIKQYDFSGNFIKDIDLPGQGSVHGFNGKIDQKRVFYFFTNYITPGNIYEYFPETGESKIFWKSPFKTDLSDFISEQVFYTSFDGTKIPMTISYKKGLNMNGDNPTILYGYGGFNISLVPGFSVAMSVWIKNGGIYAVPNIRGGGEYGKTWHNKGTGLNKKNVFKDFISAAEYLFEKKYTSSKHLALKGGSNGGLLVGAVMTMRPDIARVALLAVGVLDMLRYHLFTSGAGWAYDYGTADDSEEMFKYLLSYSPLHNIKKNVELPSVLITTGDHDDRVVPAHSFKFAARLQNDNISNSPKLIRIETRAGHGAGTPVSKLIDLNADIFAFTFYNMGISVLIK